jgi:hypothetical protein
MSLANRLNQIIEEQNISKREFAKLIGMEFCYDPEWILNGNKEV